MLRGSLSLGKYLRLVRRVGVGRRWSLLRMRMSLLLCLLLSLLLLMLSLLVQLYRKSIDLLLTQMRCSEGDGQLLLESMQVGRCCRRCRRWAYG